MRSRLHRFADHAQDQWNQRNLRHFDFDVLMTNPPFAGDLKETRILHQFDLAKKPTGKWRQQLGRDILFIERNLEFLRPGGRMCIVLPQGRLNNVSDAYIREYISKKARILAAISLHVNTFKPHANIKTTIIFLQKWNNDPKLGPLCRNLDDYPIFFAKSEKSGKDSTGEYIFKRGSDGPLLDSHGHMIVDHDLEEIADAFQGFGLKQSFEFCSDEEAG
jgi:type I restriction enzyme M protein